MTSFLIAAKRCARCRRKKALTEFYRCRTNPDGLQYRCKPCGRETQRVYARLRGVPEKRRRDPRHLALGKKQCFACNRVKCVSKFSPTARGAGGLTAYCRRCLSRQRSAHPLHRANVYRWRAKNRERYLTQHAAHQQRRRACATDGTVTLAFVRALYAQLRCHYCLRPTSRARRTLEHKTPLARGGMHSASNLVMACSRCNSRKSAMTAAEFRRSIRVSRKERDATWATQ